MRISGILTEINRLNSSGYGDNFFCALHPLAKLLVTVAFVAIVMSIEKYDILTVAFMGIYPAAAFYFSRLSLTSCLSRIYPVLFMLCFVGIANPFFDKNVLMLGQWQVNTGYVSFVALLLKGFWAVLASYSLVAATSIERLCYALRLLRISKLLVTQFLLTYRYLILLLQEFENVSAAYALRAPKQKGIQFKAWGSLVGHMLLRSMDRAEHIYAAMVMRGFRGEFYYGISNVIWSRNDILYILISCFLFLMIRLKLWQYAAVLMKGIL